MKRVIAANSNHCCIYDYNAQEGQLRLIKEFDHPENKLKDSQLVSDRPGRYQMSRTNRSAFSQESDPASLKIDNFARELARELDAERNHHDFTELVLIMSPQMEGLLTHHLNKQVAALIKHTIQKNLMHCTEAKLLQYLMSYLKQHRKPLH